MELTLGRPNPIVCRMGSGGMAREAPLCDAIGCPPDTLCWDCNTRRCVTAAFYQASFPATHTHGRQSLGHRMKVGRRAVTLVCIKQGSTRVKSRGRTYLRKAALVAPVNASSIRQFTAHWLPRSCRAVESTRDRGLRLSRLCRAAQQSVALEEAELLQPWQRPWLPLLTSYKGRQHCRRGYRGRRRSQWCGGGWRWRRRTRWRLSTV